MAWNIKNDNTNSHVGDELDNSSNDDDDDKMNSRMNICRIDFINKI